MNQSLGARFKEFIPPYNLFPLLFAYMFDSLAISSYWIFFGIWLNEEIVTGARFEHPYLILAVVLAIPSFVSIIGSSLFSIFSDKTGRRKEIMLFARLLLMTQCILLIFFNDTPWQILLILGAFGVHNVFYIMHSALITIICHPNRRGEVASFQMFFASLGWMIGSSVSGVIYSKLGMIGGLSFGAGFALLTGISAFLSPSKPSENDDDFETDHIEQIAPVKVRSVAQIESDGQSYWKILTRGSVLTLLLILAFVDFGFGPFNVLASVYLKKVGLGDNYIAWTNTIATFFGMMFQVFIGRFLDRRGRRPVFLVAVLAYPLLSVSMFLLDNFWVAIFVLYSYPLYALKIPSANAIMSDVTSERERARGMSLLQFEQTIFLNSGAFLGAYLADMDLFGQGIFILPLQSLLFGAIALLIAFTLLKETNKKLLAQNEQFSVKNGS